ncbi:hypothetical protein [Bacteroides caecimuris]|uniref:hypothetical protein n=1 Tax=Bacteroides caecimuris TaxID=1796613 RepID=UPI0026E5976A|nr:hypothetical protein [Bacteroides caecimuris]
MNSETMTDKEYRKIIADARRSVSRKYGFRQSSYINFKVEGGYFFCLFFLTGEARLTVKPLYADDLWWDIWGATENKKEPLSLRGIGAYTLSGQVLASYEIKNTTDKSKLENQFEQLFNGATAEITKFIADNPDADTFYPDESKMDHDPDRLLYLMALIHNGKEEEALSIIKEARKNKHRCIFQSGMFSDSYTYIRRWCNREQAPIRIRNVFASIFNNIVRIRAYALMALGKNNKKETLPDIYDVRLLDGGIVMTLCFSIIFIWHNFTLAWITLAVYFILVWFMDFENRSERYYIRFGNLPNKTRLRWKISMWILVVALYIYSFAIIFFEP